MFLPHPNDLRSVSFSKLLIPLLAKLCLRNTYMRPVFQSKQFADEDLSGDVEHLTEHLGECLQDVRYLSKMRKCETHM